VVEKASPDISNMKTVTRRSESKAKMAATTDTPNSRLFTAWESVANFGAVFSADSAEKSGIWQLEEQSVLVK